jgi:hypothetical protein
MAFGKISTCPFSFSKHLQFTSILGQEKSNLVGTKEANNRKEHYSKWVWLKRALLLAQRKMKGSLGNCSFSHGNVSLMS